MKLQNKKTGEIVEFGYLQSDYIAPLVLTTYENDKPEMHSYNSLTELNEEWQDYEEPKEYWFIDSLGEVHKHTKDSQLLDIEQTAIEDWHLDIGNYFETKEEAEKAVEKLKAWKRLKHKGFRFGKYDAEQRGISIVYFDCDNEIDKKDLDLLFGGEE